MNITLQQAQQVLQAAMEEAVNSNLKMNIAIVDGGANLTAFCRMDGAWLGSADIAIKKAKTALFLICRPANLGKYRSPADHCTRLKYRTAA